MSVCKTKGPRWSCITHLITRRFELNGLSVQEKKFNIDFQDGGHLGFPNRMILATSDEVSSPLAFWFRIEKFKIDFQHGRPSWISDQNDFRYFLSKSHSDTSYQALCPLAILFRSSSK